MYRFIDLSTNYVYVTIPEVAEALKLSVSTIKTAIANKLKQRRGSFVIECQGRKFKVDKLEKSAFCSHAITLSKSYGKACQSYSDLKERIYAVANQTGFSPFTVAIFVQEHGLAEVPVKLKEEIFLERPKDE